MIEGNCNVSKMRVNERGVELANCNFEELLRSKPIVKLSLAV